MHQRKCETCYIFNSGGKFRPYMLNSKLAALSFSAMCSCINRCTLLVSCHPLTGDHWGRRKEEVAGEPQYEPSIQVSGTSVGRRAAPSYSGGTGSPGTGWSHCGVLGETRERSKGRKTGQYTNQHKHSPATGVQYTQAWSLDYSNHVTSHWLSMPSTLMRFMTYLCYIHTYIQYMCTLLW